jgi:hypothetical protein
MQQYSTASTVGSRVLNERRDYQRILPDFKTRTKLREQGYTWVLSSNVSAVRVFGNDLIIRFHNGSVYKYPNQGLQYDDMINSESKGRWVWNNLRRTNVPYSKLGSMPLETDLDMTDEEVMQVGITTKEIELVKAATLALLSDSTAQGIVTTIALLE